MLKGRRRGAHARVVDHCSVGKGDVEVLADQNTLARDVDRGDRSLQSRFAMYEVRSTIRQLKPHSLSYQLTTFAQSPASIAVDGASTIDECGDDVVRRRPRPPQVLVRQVLKLLVRRVGVDRGHHASLDAE